MNVKSKAKISLLISLAMCLATGSYQCEIKDSKVNPDNIKKVWLRKQKFAGDDWKVKNLEVYMQGKRVVKQDINKWLSGNDTYTIDVNGLK